MKKVCWIRYALGLLICIPLAVLAITPSEKLNQQLQQAADQGLKDNQPAGASAVELSVLLPGEDQPRDFVAGNQFKGFGIHPATTDMMVQYGSITKEYTATLILHLVDQGYFTLDTPIGDLKINNSPVFQQEFQSGEWPARWETVTVAELLNMTSGIPDGTNNNLPSDFNPYDIYTFDEMIDISANYEKTTALCADQKDIDNGCFKPGTEYFYSNTNYTIAGLIVQHYYDQRKNSELTFGDIMDAKILKPVLGGRRAQTCLAGPGHTNALCYNTDLLPANVLVNMIHGYFNSGQGWTYLLTDMDISHTSLSWSNAAGALGGTTDGLARLTYALFHNQFYSADRLTSSHYMVEKTDPGKPVVPVSDINKTCSGVIGCYGLGVEPQYDKTLGTYWSYGGKTFGFVTLYIWIPKEDVVIVFSINSASNQLSSSALGNPVINAVNAYLGYPSVTSSALSLMVKKRFF